MYSLIIGEHEICPGVYLDLWNPTVVGTATANYFGDAWITVNVPSVASGVTVHFQAYQDCNTSNPMTCTFQ